jgi:DNA-binding transcriptional MerR regulator
MDDSRTITRAAAESGTTADTLRYYERIGILPSVGRAPSGHRRYTDLDVSWIQLVRCFRASEMPIAQLRRFADLARRGDETAGERLCLLEEHRDRIQLELAGLREALAMVERKIAYY